MSKIQIYFSEAVIFFRKYNQIMEKRGCANTKQNHTGRDDSMNKSIDAMGASQKKFKKPSSNLKKENSSMLSEIPEIPKVYLSAAQMNGDPVELLINLEKQYEQFGAVKLITPKEWSPPFSFNSCDRGITTRIQHLYKLKYGKAFKQKQEAYNARSFQDFAKDFERNYRYKFPKLSGTTEDQQEHEFWQLINGNYQGPQWKYKVTTEYAADLSVKKYGSGFPLYKSSKSQDQHFDYLTNLFNLNNTYKSPYSILKIAEKKKELISGVTIPWMYMGMLFSTFCWHVEDLWINSLNYSHSGATKTWYVVPKKYKEKFDLFVAQKTGRDDLLNRITFMLDPLELIKNGIKVYKTNQRPGEYICTFIKAYHAGFSHGFNVGEAVNFASPSSLSVIKEAMEASKKKNSKSQFVLSYQWLIYSNIINENNFKELNCVIQNEYKRILVEETNFLTSTSKECKIIENKQISDGYKYDKNSCSVCKNYQYLSSLKCISCNRNYCANDFVICCQGKYQLIFREVNKDRKSIHQFADISNKKA